MILADKHSDKGQLSVDGRANCVFSLRAVIDAFAQDCQILILYEHDNHPLDECLHAIFLFPYVRGESGLSIVINAQCGRSPQSAGDAPSTADLTESTSFSARALLAAGTSFFPYFEMEAFAAPKRR